MLGLIILLPIIGSLFFFGIENENKLSSSVTLAQKNSIIKQIGLATSLITLVLTLILFSQMNNNIGGYQFTETIAPFGFIGVDGIAIYYVLLTAFITPVALLSNWNDITYKLKYFVFSFLLLETLQIAFFCVADLFMFYIYFESVLIPLFIIIGIWGASEARIRAAFLLFLYTLGGSLFMLLAILWIIFNLGTADFNYLSLFDLSIDAQGWAFFAFFLAFAIKSPLYPAHLWLFRAHAEAPLAGSIILAAIILKLASYGFLRVLLNLLPEFCMHNMYIIHSIALITLIYSSLVVCRQIDLKAIVAYSSVSHVAVMILGLFSNTLNGIEGSILLSLAHGFVSPALFIFVGGFTYSRYHTRIINYYRGLTLTMPIFSILFFIFTIFNAGAPLSLNFIGEFLALTGTFQNSPVVGFLGASGIFFSAVYSIWLYNRVAYLGYSPFFNQPIITSIKTGSKLELGDLDRREFFLIIPLLIATVAFGLFPNTILESLHYPVSQLLINVDSSEFTRYLYFITPEFTEFDALASTLTLPEIE
jgi:NADH-ubiquinone oxidoreductase chain 4